MNIPKREPERRAADRLKPPQEPAAERAWNLWAT
jgi:hypothetical protein